MLGVAGGTAYIEGMAAIAMSEALLISYGFCPTDERA